MNEPTSADTTGIAPVQTGNYVIFRTAEPVPGDRGAEQGTIAIRHDGRLLHATWTDGSGTARAGIGLELNNRMWFARSSTPAGGAGIVYYTLEGGDLKPAWAYASEGDQDQTGDGESTRRGGPPDRFEGVFEIVYRTSDGQSNQPLELAIERRGAVYLLTWTLKGTVAFQGVGLVHDGVLGAAWAPPDGTTLPHLGTFPDFLAVGATAGSGDWVQSGDGGVGTIALADLG